MIKANELRIGNLVKDPKENIISVSGHDIYMECLRKGIKELKAIPLSEEILLKVGFEKSKGEEQRISYIDEIFWIPGMYFLEFDGVWHLYHSTDEDTYWEIKYGVKHLHELQNLIFSLTGEELNTTGL